MKATGDVCVSVVVSVPQERAFAAFTTEIGVWWREGPKYRGLSDGDIRLEPRPGGRLLEVSDDPSAGDFEIGRIQEWSPPDRLVVSWRLTNFAPDEVTHVEVTFEPVRQGTRVTVVHHGLVALRPDHPARHGLDDHRFATETGRWWLDQLRAFKQRCR